MMKFNTLFLTLLASATSVFSAEMTISTDTNSRQFTLLENQPLIVPLTKHNYTLTLSDVKGQCATVNKQKVKFNKPLALNCNKATELELRIRFSGDYAFTLNGTAPSLRINRQPKASSTKVFKRPIPDLQCEVYKGEAVTINLNHLYQESTQLRDAYSGQVVEVKDNKVTLTPSPESGGLVLLEKLMPANTRVQASPLNWKNANIYFVMIDRFNNADRRNDHAYGRHQDGLQEVGTFHGGDLKGVTEKLDYIQSLGTDAIWLSPIVEQVHGFVGGGEKGSFPFYAYHGYWTRDFTKIDENFGDDNDLKELVTQAHQRGIKVLLDVVINHAGYATLSDLQLDKIDVVTPPSHWPPQWSAWQPMAGQNWHSFQQQINYKSSQWQDWWGADWIRATLPGYQAPGNNDITSSLAGLPDMITESRKPISPPEWLLNNVGTRVAKRANYTVSDYLIEWQTDWVKRFGIDGFRIDTVKHVEPEIWKRLKSEGIDSLKTWRNKQGESGLPFFMMGEVWGHTAYRSPYFDDGFDALINFDLQKKMDKGAACFSQMQNTYQDYANTIQEKHDFNPVSYMSSHDTELFFSRFNSLQMQRNAATALLLTPGAIQVYYGDEVARKIGPYADDFHQGTRSDMVWDLDEGRQSLLKHWQTIAKFRKNHAAIGAGKHSVIKQDNAYVFSRSLQGDTVVIAFFGHQ